MRKKKKIPEMRHYKRNKKLKATNVRIQFTKEQIQERIKCTRDPYYFIENYVKIRTVDHGLQPFKMYDFQKEFIQKIDENRFVIAKLPRQVGKSTITVAYILWQVLFGPMQNIGILANKAAGAREILEKFRLAYEYIPLWMQQGVVTWNKGFVELENGSRIIASSTNSNTARGFTYNLIFLDEFAFVPENVAQEFITSVYPTITSGNTSKVVMVSTPNGMNLFHTYWEKAQKNVRGEEGGNKYVPIEAHWSVVPGRDQKWYEDTVANIGEEQFNQEFGCEFLGSQNTLISVTKLKEMVWQKPILDQFDIKMYFEPEDKRVYAITVDTSQGQKLDYSAFSVIDITEMPYKQVCVYRSNTVDPMVYPTVIMNVAKRYNDAWILVEVNPPGDQVARILKDELEYDNLLYTTTRGRGGQQLSIGFKGSSKVGVTTSHAVKIKGCTNLKSMIEADQLLIYDKNTRDEFSNFVVNSKSYSAAVGHNDDIVMSLVLFGWLAQEKLFKDITDLDIRRQIQSRKIEEDEQKTLPFGYKDEPTVHEVYVDNSGEQWEIVNSGEVANSYDDLEYPLGNHWMNTKNNDPTIF